MSTTIHSANPETLTNAVKPEDEGKSPAEYATETVEMARDFASETQELAQASARAVAADVRDTLVHGSDAAYEFAQKQPLVTAAGALAVGVVLGMAINGRR